jgi:hypothetical protein
MSAPTAPGDDVRTYTATSEQDADAWLESLAQEEGRPVVGAELGSRAGGRVRVTARLGDVTPTDEPQDAAPAAGTERVELRITVPGDDQDELDAALQRWSRDLESEHGQILDVDVRLGEAPGLYVASATVPARQRRRGPRRSGGDVTPDQPARCGSCGDKLPVRTGGPGRRRRYCNDACRSRAARQRHPAPIRCELRAGWWPCDQPAAWMIREPDDDQPNGWSRHGLKVAVCEDCAELVEAFAVRQPGVMFVARQSVADYRAEQRERDHILSWG